MPDEEPNFEGHRDPDEHRTVGSHRAWSYRAVEWCYPNNPCAHCAVQMAEDNPCPCCDGTGINRQGSDGS